MEEKTMNENRWDINIETVIKNIKEINIKKKQIKLFENTIENLYIFEITNMEIVNGLSNGWFGFDKLITTEIQSYNDEMYAADIDMWLKRLKKSSTFAKKSCLQEPLRVGNGIKKITGISLIERKQQQIKILKKQQKKEQEIKNIKKEKKKRKKIDNIYNDILRIVELFQSTAEKKIGEHLWGRIETKYLNRTQLIKLATTFGMGVEKFEKKEAVDLDTHLYNFNFIKESK